MIWFRNIIRDIRDWWKRSRAPVCSACGKTLDYDFNSHMSHASLCCECVDKMGGHNF
jgi:hypothetical protein